MATHRSVDDARALARDGYNNGLVNSDDLVDDALERLRGRAATDGAIAAEVARAAEEHRGYLTEDMTDPSSAQDLTLFILYPNGDRSRTRRSSADSARLFDAYLSAWTSGFRSRLERRVRDLRSDLADEVAREMTRGR
jgi:hypothetical protein